MSPSAKLDQARRVNSACDHFEADWRAGLSPKIENYLQQGSASDPPELLIELLALEVELRQAAGDQPTYAEYQGRFPASRTVIETAFGILARPSPDETLVFAGSLNLGDSVKAVFTGLGLDFGDFDLLEEVARGGMGVIYKARKRSLNCLVALKVMQAGPLASDQEKRRFLLEAEVAANLDHPNIVPVFEIDRLRGLFFTMKWVEGGSLADQVDRLRGNPAEAARLVATVAHAVHSAHLKGYLHRDLKPTNILLDAHGKPFLTDFGLALRIDACSELTQLGAVLGTPSYMAPEQAAGKGETLGPEADVYSLGAVLYELLTGCPPFQAATVMETLVAVLEKEPVPPTWLRSGVPPELEAICLKCLEKEPLDRYPSAAELADDLDHYLRGEGVKAIRSGISLRVRRWTRQEPQLVARLLALGAFETLTQLNYLFGISRHPVLHLQVSITLAIWALIALVLQGFARRQRSRLIVQPIWSAADAVFLTLTLWLLDGVGSSMVVGCPLLVAASGLCYRVGVVWLATGFAEIGFGVLVFVAWLNNTLWTQAHHPNVVIAAIAVAGFVVARQVKRFLVLSSYYENCRVG